MAMIRSTNDLLRELPSIDSLLRTATALSLQPLIGAEHLGALARRVTDELRKEIQAAGNVERSVEDRDGSFSRDSLLEEAERRLAAIYQQESIRGLSHVINATGVILHTNLGRASLSDAASRAIRPYPASPTCLPRTSRDLPMISPSSGATCAPIEN